MDESKLIWAYICSEEGLSVKQLQANFANNSDGMLILGRVKESNELAKKKY